MKSYLSVLLFLILGGKQVLQAELPCFNFTSVQAWPADWCEEIGLISISVDADYPQEVEYSIDGGQSWSPDPVFTLLPPGSYSVAARYMDGDCLVFYENNPLVVGRENTAATTILGVFAEPPSNCASADGVIDIWEETGIKVEYLYRLQGYTSWQSGKTFTGLPSGSYNVEICIDDNQYCIFYEATVVVPELPSPVITDVLVTQPNDCSYEVGAIEILVAEGTDWEYSIDGGSSWQSSPVFSAVPLGEYAPAVRHPTATNCLDFYAFAVSILPMNHLSIDNILPHQTLDCGEASGFINVLVSGAGGPVLYSVDGGASWGGAQVLQFLPAGFYDLAVRENVAGSCITYASEPVEITEPFSPEIEWSIGTDPSDCGVQDGTIEVYSNNYDGVEYSVDGGVTWPYYFNSGRDHFLTGLPAGEYYLASRKPFSNCINYFSETITLTEPLPLTISILETTDPTDCGAFDGRVSIEVKPDTVSIGFGYTVDGGNTWETISGNIKVFDQLGAGTYQVAVRYQNGQCLTFYETPIELTDPPMPVIEQVTFGNPTDCGAADGRISVTATHGTGSYQYSVDAGNSWQTPPFFNDLPQHTYSLIVRNGDGTCPVSYTELISLSDPPEPGIAGINKTDPTDCEAGDGSILINGQNGMGSYAFSIDNGASWQSEGEFDNLSPGSYHVALRNADGTCIQYHTEVIALSDPPAPIIADAGYTDPTDCEANDGSITINAQASTGSYAFSIDGGTIWQSQQLFTDLPPGDYAIALRNADGTCVQHHSETISLTDPPAPMIVGVDYGNPTDCGAGDGSISVHAQGGTSSYAFSIDGGSSWQSGADFSHLSPGDYSIALRNADGTCVQYHDETISLSDPPVPIIGGVTFTDPTDCGAADGSITITGQAGTGPYAYSIDNGASWQSQGGFEELTPGNYDIALRNTDGTCVQYYGETISLSDPPSPVIDGVNYTDPSDCEAADGSITITGQAGTGAYAYSIDNGASWQSQAGFGELAPGDYAIALRNADGTCVQYHAEAIALSDPPAPSIGSVTYTQPTDCGAGDGSIVITGQHGTGSYSFSIDNGANWRTGANFNDLAPGEYAVALRNADGTCVQYYPETIRLADPPMPIIAGVNWTDPTDCHATDGSITIGALAGTGAYQYSVDGGTTWSMANVFSTLGQGEYQLILRNLEGTCPVALDTHITLRDPPSPRIAELHYGHPTDCDAEDGYIHIYAVEGIGPYEYSIDGGQTWGTLLYQNPPGSSAMPDGVYEIGVRNNDGTCPVYYGEPIALSDPPKPVIQAVDVTQPSSCANEMGIIYVSHTGGSGPIQVSMDGGGSWDLENYYSDLPPGEYPVAIRNADGTCLVQTEDEIIIEELTRPLLDSVQVISLSDCGADDAVIQLFTSGSLSIFHEFSVDGGQSWSTGATFYNLPPGTYFPTARMSYDPTCRTDHPEPIELVEPRAAMISAVTSNHPTDCGAVDGAIHITAIEGSNGLPDEVLFSIDGGGNWWSGDGEISGLPAGEYTLAVRNNGSSCISYYEETVTLSDPPAPGIASVEATDPSDCQAGDGTITISGQAGMGVYEYSIDGGGSWQGTAQFTDLPPGEYQPAIRNTDGTCVQTPNETITLSDPPAPDIALVEATDPSDCEAGDGTITISGQSGMGVYEYSIDGGSSWKSTAQFTDLSPGDYQPTIRNADGTCVQTPNETVTLSDPPAPDIASVEATDPSDCEAGDGTITISGQAGMGVYEYSIDGGNSWQSTAQFTDLPPGDYQPAIRNADGTCVQAPLATVTLSDPPAPGIASVEATDPSDCEAGDGVIIVTGQAGMGVYEYSIDGGNSWQSTAQFTDLSPGAYQPAIRNADGTCVQAPLETVTLSDPPAPDIASVEATDPSDCQAGDGTIAISAQAGMGVYEYSIDGGGSWQSTAQFTGLSPGEYQPAIRNADGTCVQTPNETITLSDPPAPGIASVEATDPNDCEAGDGVIIVTGQAGIGVYEYSIDGGGSWQGTAQFTDLSPGDYQPAIRNADGTCVQAPTTTVTLSDPPAPDIASVEAMDPSDCEAGDGVIIVSGQSGIGVYEYSIDGGGSWQSTAQFTDLSPGEYQPAIRNADGTCVQAPLETVTLSDPPAPNIAAIDQSDPTDCEATDGTIRIVAQGGVGGYQYSIDGGVEWSNNQTFQGLVAHTYEVRIRNANGTCEQSALSPITLRDPPAPEILSVSAVDPSDCNLGDGEIAIDAQAGNGGIQFSISSGVSWTNTGYFGNLASGEYNVVIRNSDGTCIEYYEDAILLTEPAAPIILETGYTDPTDCGSTDGTIFITAAGGQGTYQYSINGGASWQPDGHFTDLSPGGYSLAIRNDDETCTILHPQTLTLQAPAAPAIIDVIPQPTSDCGVADGQIQVVLAAGGDYRYSKDGGITWSSEAVFTRLSPDNYSVAVQNADGSCKVYFAQPVEIGEPMAPQIQSIEITDPSDCGLSDAGITIYTEPTDYTREYSIDNGASWQLSPLFSELNGGNYRIAVRNAGGRCITWHDQTTVLHSPEPPVVVDIEIAHPTYCGSQNGNFQVVTASPSQYSLDGESWRSNNAFSGLGAGQYSLYVRNTDGSCETPYLPLITLVEPGPPLILDVSTTGPTVCEGVDGRITITAQNAAAYSIDGGASWQSSGEFANLSSGSYAVLARSSGGNCEVSYSEVVSLVAPSAPTIIAVEAIDPTACEGEDGRISVTAEGATDYSIDGGATWHSSGEFVNLSSGSYAVRARSSGGNCEVSYSEVVSLVAPSAPNITEVEAIDPTTCEGADGRITITAEGAVAYSIDGGATWQSNSEFANLDSGSYAVRARSSGGNCEVNYSEVVSLVAPSAPTITEVEAIDPTTCEGEDGRITITAEGATGYSIDGGATWQSNGEFTNLSSGSYAIRARSLGGNCEVNYSEVVSLVAPSAPTITAVTAIDPTTCEGEDGRIAITAQNAADYSIDGGATWQSNGEFTNLSSGSYAVRARSSGGSCEVSYSEVVSLVAPSAPTITAVTAIDPTTCEGADGRIAITAEGATEYSIDGGVTWQSSGEFANLRSGNYAVRARSLGGNCEVSYSEVVSLVAPSAPNITAVTAIDPTTCEGEDGRIAITAEGASEYSIDGGVTWQSDNGFANLSSGSYAVRARSSGGSCEVSYTEVVSLVAPRAPTITAVTAIDPTTCEGEDGRIAITAEGATAYSIDGGATWHSSSAFGNLSSGSYAVRARSLGGNCEVSYSEVVSLVAPSTPTITEVTAIDPTTCEGADGRITITAEGAVAYSIDGGATWHSSSAFGNLSSGSYAVRARSLGGNCEVNYSEVVSLVAPRAPTITEVAAVDPTTCEGADGLITITAEGATAYSIDGGATWHSSGEFVNLSSGSYAVRARSLGGSCEVSYSEVVNLVAPSAPTITAVTAIDPTTCDGEDGRIAITAEGASEYSIDGGVTWQSDNGFANLSSGSYAVRARSLGGNCEVSYSEVVSLVATSSPTITAVEAIDPTTCEGADGRITITAQNAADYSIDGGASWQSSGEFSNLSSGSYAVLARSSGGSCEVSYSEVVSLVAPSAPTITEVEAIDPTTCEGEDGRMSITAEGATGYSIDGGATWQSSGEFANLSSGNYTIRARSSGGNCEVSYTEVVSLVAPSAPTITAVTAIDPTTCEGADGRITITAEGATGYSIDGGATWQTSGEFVNLGSGSYTVHTRSSGGNCEVSYLEVVSLVAPSAPTITAVAAIDPTTCEGADGRITITAEGATEYSIDGGVTWQSNSEFANLGSGSYAIRARSSGGNCEVSYLEVVSLVAPSAPTITAVEAIDPTTCEGEDGRITIIAEGATDYSIDGGATWQSSGEFANLSSGSYALRARSMGGNCEVSYSEVVSLVAPSAPTITEVTAIDPTTCEGDDGRIAIMAKGATDYSIDGGATWQSSGEFVNLSSGNYTIRARSMGGNCEVSYSEVVNLVAPSAPTITAVTAIDPTTCKGEDGRIAITAEGASEYSIDGGVTWQSDNGFANLSSGSYAIRARSSGGSCEVSYSEVVSLVAPSAPTITEVTAIDPTTCEGADGRITITAEGAVAYSIDGGATWQSSSAFGNLSSGSYSVRARSSGGSCEVSYTEVVSLVAPSAPTITAVTAIDPTTCEGEDGRIAITAEGATDYSIDGGATWHSSGEFANLSSGSYTVRARSSGGICEVGYTEVVSLVAPSAPIITAVEAIDPTTCEGADGRMIITAEGASEYSIDGGQSWSPDTVFEHLSAGNYQVAVRSQDSSCQVQLEESLVLQSSNSVFFDTLVVSHPTYCRENNGRITVRAVGEDSLLYSIDGGISWSSTGIFQRLTPGVYRPMLQTLDGRCQTVYPEPLALELLGAPQIVSVEFGRMDECVENSGYLIMEVESDGDDLEYSINGGIAWQDEAALTGLSGGTYLPFVRYRGDNCIIPYDEVVTLPTLELPEISQVQNHYVSDCRDNGGSIWIQATGGREDFEFSIDSGYTWTAYGIFHDLLVGEYRIAVRNAGSACAVFHDEAIHLSKPPGPAIAAVEEQPPGRCSGRDGAITIHTDSQEAEYSIDGGLNWSPQHNFSGLGAGRYRIAVRDVGGCVTIQPEEVVYDSVGLPSISDVVLENGADCTGGSGRIRIIMAGGEPADYRYSLDGGLNWSEAPEFTNLMAGEYELLVKTAIDDCEIRYAEPLFITTPDPPVITEIITVEPSSCNEHDGSLQISTFADNAEFTIDGGAHWSKDSVFTALASGQYRVGVRTPGEGCETFAADSLQLGAEPGPDILEVAVSHPTYCRGNNGRISISAQQSSDTLYYSIDAGRSWQPEPLFNRLTAGRYEVRIRAGQSGCATHFTEIIELKLLSAPKIHAITINEVVRCGADQGSLTIVASGDTDQLEYSINGGLHWTTNATFDQLAPAEYQVFVRYAGDHCVVAHEELIDVRPPRTPTFDNILAINPSNCTDHNGEITLLAEETDLELEYSIDGGRSWSPDSLFTGLGIGIYQATIRQAGGRCPATPQAVRLSTPAAPRLEAVTVNDQTDCERTDGSILIVADGGLGATSYSIDHGLSWQGNPLFSNLAGGHYWVSVRSADTACVIVYPDSILVEAPQRPIIDSIIVDQPDSCHISDGSISLMMSNDSLYYEFSLDAGAHWRIEPRFDQLGTGAYNIQVRNLDGSCLVNGTEPVVLSPPGLPSIDSIALVNPSACGSSDGRLLIHTTNDEHYEYTLDQGRSWQLQPAFDRLPVGWYQLQIRNRQLPECSLRYDSLHLAAPFAPTIDSIAINQPDNCEMPNGKLSVVGATLDRLLFSIDGGQSWRREAVFTGLAPAVYQLLVADSSGRCRMVLAGNLVLEPPSGPVIDTVISDAALACTADDGRITIVGNTEQTSVYSIDGGASWTASSIFDSLSSGKYLIAVRDENTACMTVLADSTSVQGYAVLTARLDTLLQPACYLANGVLMVSATGGLPPYRFNWSDGQQGPEAVNLLPGSYKLTVSDSRDCEDSSLVVQLADETFAAAKIAINDTSLCAGQSVRHVLDSVDNADIAWYRDVVLLSREKSLEIFEAGRYELLLTHANGCRLRDTFNVQVSAATLEADLLLPTAGLIDQPIVAVDVTFPVPDSIRWEYDHKRITTLQSYANQEMVLFTEPGDYSIRLHAYGAGCYDVMEKTIRIYDSMDSLTVSLDTLQTGAGIREFLIYPNPNQGEFFAKVLLTQPAVATLWLFQEEGKLIGRRDLQGSATYVEYFDLPTLGHGLYTAVLQTDESWRYVNFIVH